MMAVELLEDARVRMMKEILITVRNQRKARLDCRKELLGGGGLAAMVTDFEKCYWTQHAALQHLVFGKCFSIAGQQYTLTPVGNLQHQRIVVGSIFAGFIVGRRREHAYLGAAKSDRVRRAP